MKKKNGLSFISDKVLTNGSAKLWNGMTGEIIKVYRSGQIGLFIACNGPCFTVTSDDIADQPILPIGTLITELNDCFLLERHEHDVSWSNDNASTLNRPSAA